MSPPVTSSFWQTLNQRGDMIQPINRMGHGDEEPDITCDDIVTRGRGRGTQAGQAGSCSLGRDWARGKQGRDPGLATVRTQDADTKVRFTAILQMLLRTLSDFFDFKYYACLFRYS